jgi:hydroxyacylglutathione hydrolase
VKVIPIPCLADNYAYLLIEGGEAAVVDASEPGPVREAAARAKVRVRAILSTHHHFDHVGGNEELAREFGAPVYGGENDKGRLPGLTSPVADGDTVSVVGERASVIHIPGHTLGHVAYFFPGHVFTGDTLFFAGCGRLFEGTPEMMHVSLNRKLGSLPDDTRVYCGHEYTLKNLEFALTVEPGNARARKALEEARAKRKAGKPTVPSTIGLEKEVNPFMRASSPEIQASVRAKYPDAPQGLSEKDLIEILARVREMKDDF